ncbi:MAG: FtsQ-type POTRA domain-containing protein [Clostridiales bacterium]|nr:FtsQ-type POTRA domain-containing protein [bacterium 210917-SL.2.15]MCI5842174.1 FtsQ-type POTRA domain-containing protein [Clostridiales bacterium]MDY4037254.1 FtsQ-type POTRA domain-containing protein [Candidatus Pseudoscilispira sp.]
MARRRHTRRRRHHRSAAVLYKLLSVVVISGAIVAALTLFFKVETITVSGTTEYSSEEIITASGVKQGDNLFLLNKYEIYESILEKLPYVSSVSISRKLPDTLLIEVTDSNQGGVIEDHGTYWVLSAEGKLLGKRAEAGRGALITGLTLAEPEVGKKAAVEEGQERALKQLLDLLAALEEKGMLQGVGSFDFSQESVISIKYADRYVVKFPYGADFPYKLTRLGQVIERLEEQGDQRAGVLDLTADGEIHFIPD